MLGARDPVPTPTGSRVASYGHAMPTARHEIPFAIATRARVAAISSLAHRTFVHYLNF
jgi:hypothetical protein